MNRIQFATCVLVATALQMQLAVAIDVVARKSDKPAQGDITKISKDSIIVKPGVGADITVPANDIVSVKWGSEPVNLNLGRSAEESGNIDRALELYKESAADPAAKGDIKSEIDFLTARATAARALEQDATKVDAAIAALDGFVKANGSNFRYYDALYLLGKTQLLKEDFTAAGDSFTKLGQAPWTDYQMAAQNATAALALKSGDLAGALSAYESVLNKQGTSPGEISRRNEALLGKASVQIRQSGFDEALNSVNEALKDASPEDTPVQAQAYVLKGDCLKSQGRTKEAILAYLHVPVLFEREKVMHAEALYNLSLLWPKVDEAERGIAAAQELRDTYPDSPWTSKLQ